MRVILLAAGLLTCATATSAQAEIARVKSIEGKALVVRGRARIAATPGLPLEPGDRLIAPQGSRLSVTFIDNSRLALAPGTQLAVNRFDYDRRSQSGRFDATLRTGSVAVVAGLIARSGASAMLLRTGGSALAIRSGRLVVSAP